VRERASQERSLSTVAILMGYNKRKVLEVLESFQTDSDGRMSIDLHGHSIGAEETHKKIGIRRNAEGEHFLASLQRLLDRNPRVLHLDKRSKWAIIPFFNLTDPASDLA
jgi:hypothetical protein